MDLSKIVFMINPPSEEQRIKNELTEGASEILSQDLAMIFNGRWPSMT